MDANAIVITKQTTKNNNYTVIIIITGNVNTFSSSVV